MTAYPPILFAPLATGAPVQPSTLDEAFAAAAGSDLSNFQGRQTAVPYGIAARANMTPGTDITAALQAAIAPYSQTRIPECLGAVKLSASIQLSHGSEVIGANGASNLFRTGDYGDTFVLGYSQATGYPNNSADYGMRGGGISDLVIWAEHGQNGPGLNQNPATYINPTTKGAHIRAFQPTNVYVQNITSYGLQHGLYVHGGSLSRYENLFHLGQWDPLYATLQEGVSCFTVDTDYSDLAMTMRIVGTQAKNSFFRRLYGSGGVATGRTINLPPVAGSGTVPTYTGVASCGPQNPLHIYCGETNVFEDCYLGYGQTYLVLFEAQANVALLNLTLNRFEFDGTGGAASHVGFRSANANYAQKININDCQFAAQGGAYCGVQAETNYSNPALPTISKLSLNNNDFADYIGPVMILNGAHGVTVVGDTAENYNCNAFYNASSAQSSYSELTANAKGVAIVGCIIGGDDQLGTSANCLYSVVNVGGALVAFEGNSDYSVNGALGLPPKQDIPFLVAALPANAVVGSRAYATNARNPGEAAGSGTGSVVSFNGSIWRIPGQTTAVTF